MVYTFFSDTLECVVRCYNTYAFVYGKRRRITTTMETSNRQVVLLHEYSYVSEKTFTELFMWVGRIKLLKKYCYQTNNAIINVV